MCFKSDVRMYIETVFVLRQTWQWSHDVSGHHYSSCLASFYYWCAAHALPSNDLNEDKQDIVEWGVRQRAKDNPNISWSKKPLIQFVVECFCFMADGKTRGGQCFTAERQNWEHGPWSVTMTMLMCLWGAPCFKVAGCLIFSQFY